MSPLNPLSEPAFASLTRLPYRLAIAVVVLCSMHLVVMLVHYEFVEIDWLIRSLFDLDEEQSFGTWFSSLILLLAAIILLFHAQKVSASGQPMAPAWWCLGAGFCLLSIDETVGMHESLNTATEISWAIPGAIAVALIGTIYLPFLLRLPRYTMYLFVASATLYLGGALGIELLTESYEEEDLLDTLGYNLTTLVEEGLEMSGVVLFIHALLQHITREADSSA